MSDDRARGLHRQVVHVLGTRIVSGRLSPGATLDLPALEDELGISHTVLRESLKVLTAKGLVGARQKRGTFVTDPDSWNMLDNDVLHWRTASPELFDQLAEVRLIIEPAAAALAAQRAVPADLDALAACLENMEHVASDSDTERAAEADLAFHAALLRATHNDLLASLRSVIEHGLRQRDLLIHADPRASDPIPSHRAVLLAIEQRDPEAAGAAMLALLHQAATDFDAMQVLDRPGKRRRRA